MFFNKRLIVLLLSLIVILNLAGCCTIRSCDINDSIEVLASQQVNSCDSSSQHPVTLRIFGLSKTDVFQQASFDELWHDGKQTLGTDSVYLVEKVILPGQTVVLEPIREDGVVAIGIVANFCRLTPDCWRKTIPLGKKAKRIKLHVEKTCISVK